MDLALTLLYFCVDDRLLDLSFGFLILADSLRGSFLWNFWLFVLSNFSWHLWFLFSLFNLIIIDAGQSFLL